MPYVIPPPRGTPVLRGATFFNPGSEERPPYPTLARRSIHPPSGTTIRSEEHLQGPCPTFSHPSSEEHPRGPYPTFFHTPTRKSYGGPCLRLVPMTMCMMLYTGVRDAIIPLEILLYQAKDKQTMTQRAYSPVPLDSPGFSFSPFSLSSRITSRSRVVSISRLNGVLVEKSCWICLP